MDKIAILISILSLILAALGFFGSRSSNRYEAWLNAKNAQINNRHKLKVLMTLILVKNTDGTSILDKDPTLWSDFEEVIELTEKMIESCSKYKKTPPKRIIRSTREHNHIVSGYLELFEKRINIFIREKT